MSYSNDLTEVQPVRPGPRADVVQLQGTRSPYDSTGGADSATKVTGGVYGQFNRAAKLREGHLLVSLAARGTVFQVDPETGEVEYLFTLAHEQEPFLWRVLAGRDGTIFCTLSGSRDHRQPTDDAVFGLAGAVVRVDQRLGEIELLAMGDDIVDPCGLQIIDETRLCVTDFRGFGGTGEVYLVDRLTGDRDVIARGAAMKDPVSAFLDGAGRIWVANSYMHYFYPQRSGGIQRDDGELLCVEGGKHRIVMPRRFPAAGSVVGVHASNDEDHVIVIKGDWPLMENGAVLRVHKTTGHVEVLLAASPEEPRFYSTHVDVYRNTLWVGESYRKELLCYDLEKGGVVKVIPFGQIMGPYIGVASSFEGIESISVVPSQAAGPEAAAASSGKIPENSVEKAPPHWKLEQ